VIRTSTARTSTRAASPHRRTLGQAAICLIVIACLLLAGCGSSSSGSSSSGSSSSTSAGASTSASGPAATSSGTRASSQQCARNKAVGTINFVSPFAYDASAGIMDVFMAQKLGYFQDLCLKVDINAASFTGEELVSSGRAQVTGIGSAADAMLSAASGANLTGVATYGNTDPHVILTNEKVTTLKQLEGGTLGYYTNMNPGSLQMFANAGVDVSKIKLVKLTNFDPTIVTRGQVDGLVGYASNQGTTLKAAGQPFHAFYPSQYGVKGTYNVMQFNTSWLKDHRASAADFMRADLKALAYCLTNKAACVNYISQQAAANHQGAAFPTAHQLAVWNVESQFIVRAPRPFGSQTVAEWEPEYGLVKKYYKQVGLPSLSELPPLASMLDPTLVASLYKDNKLIWPGS
jgi:ABC-type nitrate/sulfonate/bicarbonate transport system substrate-binding protein